MTQNPLLVLEPVKKVDAAGAARVLRSEWGPDSSLPAGFAFAVEGYAKTNRRIDPPEQEPFGLHIAIDISMSNGEVILRGAPGIRQIQARQKFALDLARAVYTFTDDGDPVRKWKAVSKAFDLRMEFMGNLPWIPPRLVYVFCIVSKESMESIPWLFIDGYNFKEEWLSSPMTFLEECKI